MEKPKVGFYWCASCGGCEEAVLDLNEDILKVVDAVDIIFWPVALDFKKKDVESMEDGSVTVSFINGAVRLSEQEEVVKLLRKKSGLVVAFGSCAHMGGIPALANISNKNEIFKRAYKKVPSVVNLEEIYPQEKVKLDVGELELPSFYNTVKPLDRVVDVDYYLPGCPPPPDLIMKAVNAILEGKLPPKGAVIAPDKTLCETCERNKTKPDKLKIKEMKRIFEIVSDDEKCFLEQGIICLGPATRTGCGERCIKGNMPCRGCFGPTDSVIDQGAKFLSALASIIDTNEQGEIQSIVETIPDLIGTFYRFSLASSLLKRKKLEA